MPFVELHARSAFSFLQGGSLPEHLVLEAARLGLPALALCDRAGFYGAVRLHTAAREAGLRALVGCELPLEDGSLLPVLIAKAEAYHRLSRLLTTAHLRSEKGQARLALNELEGQTEGLIALTGDAEGPLRRAWQTKGANAAEEAGQTLLRLFGPTQLYVELQRHLHPEEEEPNEFLVTWAQRQNLPLLASNGALQATPEEAELVDVLTCLREHCTLESAGRRLLRNRERHLKGEAEMRRLFADLPEAVDNTERLAAQLDFTLDQLGYRFPDYAVPQNEDQISFLRKVTFFGAQQRYGSVVGEVRKQLERELSLIGKLGFSGYFLIVWDLCTFAREKGILVQGRGSAANSAVCYSLGITAVDPVGGKLLFERFLSEGRTDWPDIDLDLPSGGRREQVIQEVYRRYGRRGAAMTANVICFRSRSTVREVGKVLGLPEEVLERFAGLFHGGDYPQTLKLRDQLRQAGIPTEDPRFPLLTQLCQRLYGLPRHLGQHSGGMVLSAGGLDRVVPLENARMPGRSVLQWDKSDCEDLGIVKVDLLGLGMMAALQDALDICARRGDPVDLARLPKDDPATFRMIQEADTVGLFQIESRAQMATLPRMKPETFYDLVIEVAIIRPGPIQGKAVNPYLKRRMGLEPVTYPDERLRSILERTLGVVLFQEQILRVAMELGGFSAAQADELRRAIGFTRSPERLERMKSKLAEALRRNLVSEEAIEQIIQSLAAFALYGFPESHAISFALIVYASAWLKAHRPSTFYATLLNNQPMGFYSPASLVQDARRHGVQVLPVCIRRSEELCVVESPTCLRLGLRSLRDLRRARLHTLLEERQRRPFSSLEDFLRRTHLNPAERRTLAASGALNALAEHRRAALWQVEAVNEDDDLFRYAAAAAAEAGRDLAAETGAQDEAALSPLERMSLLERLQADYTHLALTTGPHPMHLFRTTYPELTRASDLASLQAGQRVHIGGSVITRQRPGTAKGFCFITLEDETGHANAIVRPRLFEDRRQVINLEPALRITGRLQNERGVLHVMAETIAPLHAQGLPEASSHDFH